MSSSIAQISRATEVQPEKTQKESTKIADASHLFSLMLGGLIGSGSDTWQDLASMTAQSERDVPSPPPQKEEETPVSDHADKLFSSAHSGWPSSAQRLSTEHESPTPQQTPATTNERAMDSATKSTTKSAETQQTKTDATVSKDGSDSSVQKQTEKRPEITPETEQAKTEKTVQQTAQSTAQTDAATVKEVQPPIPQPVVENKQPQTPVSPENGENKKVEELVDKMVADEGEKEGAATEEEMETLTNLVESAASQEPVATVAETSTPADQANPENIVQEVDVHQLASTGATGETTSDSGAGQQQQQPGKDGLTAEQSILSTLATVRGTTKSFSANMTDQLVGELQNNNQHATTLSTGITTGAAANIAGGGNVNIQLERIQDLVRRFDEHLLSMIKSSESDMTITITPEKYGKLVVNCKETDDGLVVQVQAQNPAVCDLLTQETAGIKQLMQQNGYKLSAFDVFTGSGDSSRSQQHGNSYGDTAETDQRNTAGSNTRFGTHAPADDAPSEATGTGITDKGVWFLA